MKIGVEGFTKRIQKIRGLELKGRLSAMLKIEIKTGNAAFCDPFTGEPSEFDEAIECKRLLEGICRELEDGATNGSIIDINGNKVGQWSR